MYGLFAVFVGLAVDLERYARKIEADIAEGIALVVNGGVIGIGL